MRRYEYMVGKLNGARDLENGVQSLGEILRIVFFPILLLLFFAFVFVVALDVALIYTLVTQWCVLGTFAKVVFVVGLIS